MKPDKKQNKECFKLNRNKMLVHSALLAAIYTVLTLSTPFMSYGAVQFRISEAMCLLPAVMPGSTVGVVLGCFITNLLGAFSGANPIGIIDSIVGSIATLLSCLSVRYLFYKIKNKKLLGLILPLPVILFNSVIIGLELAVIYPPVTLIKFLSFAGSVGLGEMVVLYTLGNVLLYYLLKKK
jgi:uncharacterized membrane protein